MNKLDILWRCKSVDSYRIQGGKKLEGEITVSGAKNAVLPILAGCIATGGESRINNCPDLSDVRNMILILQQLGCKVEKEGSSITINSKNIHTFRISEKLMREMRSSVFLMGPMISRFGKVELSYPGGCEIGLRPIDIHLSALRKMGVSICEKGGYLECTARKIAGDRIPLDFPSVGATENIMLTAIGAAGETVIINAAKEPEILDLQNFLNSCGAKITGAGTSQIKIAGHGVLSRNKLRDTEYTVMPDRIECGTFLCAVATTGGCVHLKNADPENMAMTISKLEETGCKMQIEKESISIEAPERLSSVGTIQTQPYPGFPTDMQSQFLSLMAVANGTTLITETIFENRFKQVDQLRKMGAKISIEGRNAIVTGVERLMGAKVFAKDLRGGAALVLAGLAAEGETTIEDIFHIDRGYENLKEKLESIGAEIERVTEVR